MAKVMTILGRIQRVQNLGKEVGGKPDCRSGNQIAHSDGPPTEISSLTHIKRTEKSQKESSITSLEVNGVRTSDNERINAEFSSYYTRLLTGNGDPSSPIADDSCRQ